MPDHLDTATSIIAFDALRDARVSATPYPHALIPQLLREEHLAAVVADFPDIRKGGSFNLSDVECRGAFATLIGELKSDAFRDCLAGKFELDLADKPVAITLRGYSRAKADGHIHTDSKSKLITVLIYLNPSWAEDTGRLRLLNSQRIDDAFAEVPPSPGSTVIFKVTENGWHGYLPFEGVRRSIQLNFLTSGASAARHRLLHGFSAMFKGKRGRM
ncbi:MAG TPA: 2OG-Fe(II) oxygenase [Casimicrobiaceae bacterium]|nr:2OG-Fe(II) oxygenase [Casimicrobiaceae bacterium]